MSNNENHSCKRVELKIITEFISISEEGDIHIQIFKIVVSANLN